MHPTGNLVADTICRTAELGLTITDAADAGTLTIINAEPVDVADTCPCLLYTSPSPRDVEESRMPSSA